MRHPSHVLGAWEGLTTGAPAAFAEPSLVSELEGELAELMGCSAAALAPSTLHAFWDLFDMIACTGHDIFLDSGAYEVARWGAERAACRGARVTTFPSHDAAPLHELVGRGRPAVVVTDGIDALTGHPAPLVEYTRVAERTGGMVVIDDTQAIGLLGRPARASAFGAGGGGSIRRHGLEGRPVVLIASLAKAFGAPLTVIGGSALFIRRFKARSRTRIHCSPPSVASLAGARRAVRLNRRAGDVLRARLERNIRCFRALLRERGVCTRGGLFPAQTLDPIPGVSSRDLHARLDAAGIETILRATPDGPRVCFIITASHTREQIALATAQVVAAASARARSGVLPCLAS
jgi:8-amino-7-oxononanoate synthase